MKKILYFVRGGIASPDQKKEAVELGAFIRNANVGANDFVEKCDAVAGDVPEQYGHYPRVGGEERQVEVPVPSIAATVTPSVVAVPEQAEAQQESTQEQAAPSSGATGRIEEYRAALMEKTVREQREIAKANGIPLPADINTKEEIADYVSVRLAQS